MPWEPAVSESRLGLGGHARTRWWACSLLTSSSGGAAFQTEGLQLQKLVVGSSKHKVETEALLFIKNVISYREKKIEPCWCGSVEHRPVH